VLLTSTIAIPDYQQIKKEAELAFDSSVLRGGLELQPVKTTAPKIFPQHETLCLPRLITKPTTAVNSVTCRKISISVYIIFQSTATCWRTFSVNPQYQQHKISGISRKYSVVRAIWNDR
jgi:hypothetical protein